MVPTMAARSGIFLCNAARQCLPGGSLKTMQFLGSHKKKQCEVHSGFHPFVGILVCLLCIIALSILTDRASTEAVELERVGGA